MGNFLRYCLSLLCAAFFIGCQGESLPASWPERQALAQERYTSENQKHGFDFVFQGTPKGMTLLDEILAIDSTNAAALRAMSVPYLKRGMPHKWKPWRGYLYLWFYRDYEKAIADFNASDTLTPYLDYPQGHSVDFWRGIAYLGLKKYPESISFWDGHIERETQESGEDWVELEAFLYRGIAHYEFGQNEKALMDFDKILQYHKRSSDAHYHKARIFLEQGKQEAALLEIDSAHTDFHDGYFNHREYVETLRQIYLSDIAQLKSEIMR